MHHNIQGAVTESLGALLLLAAAVFCCVLASG